MAENRFCMNALEQRLHYPLGHTLPAPGHALEVSPGVRWLRMPLPFALNHINLWLLRDRQRDAQGQWREGWSVVDTGIHHADTQALWEQVFAQALDGLPVLRVLATHMHPDHIGLAHWLCERFGVDLWISATDYYVARLAVMGGAAFDTARTQAFYASHGLNDPAVQEQLAQRNAYFPSLVPAWPSSYRRLRDGLALEVAGAPWQCLAGYGHAPEHMAFFRADTPVLIAGDMVLPRISTNISVYESEPEANPLAQFLESLQALRTLPPDTLVLPSHGRPFTGLHERIDQLCQHHQERLQEVRQACAQQPRCAHDLLPQMFGRTLDAHQTPFALGEAVAHLHWWWHQGALQRRADDHGVWRFLPH